MPLQYTHTPPRVYTTWLHRGTPCGLVDFEMRTGYVDFKMRARAYAMYLVDIGMLYHDDRISGTKFTVIPDLCGQSVM